MENIQMQTQDEIADPARISALNRVLGVDDDTPQPFSHHVLFWDARSAHELGRDGHPRTGGIIPDMGLPRRMWAGGALEFIEPLQVGVATQKKTYVDTIERKEGRSGPLAFVSLVHEVSQGQICIRERQDLVAQHLMLMAQDALGSLATFSFRATSPLMDFEEASLAAVSSEHGLRMWVAGPDGRQCMQAEASA